MITSHLQIEASAGVRLQIEQEVQPGATSKELFIIGPADRVSVARMLGDYFTAIHRFCLLFFKSIVFSMPTIAGALFLR